MKKIRKKFNLKEREKMMDNNELTLVIKQNKYYGGKISVNDLTKEKWLVDVVEFFVIFQPNGGIVIIGLLIGDIALSGLDLANTDGCLFGVITKESSFYEPYYRASSGIKPANIGN